MTTKILVLGESGTGKTRSILGLNPEETFIINCDRKDLSFKGARTKYKLAKTNKDFMTHNMYYVDEPSKITALMKAISDKRPEIKNIIIDTLTLAMNSQFMNKVSEKGYEKYNVMSYDAYESISVIDDIREDLTVVVMAHSESNDTGEGYRKSEFKVPGGKFLKEKIDPLAMFTVVLETEVQFGNESPTYSFITNSNGRNCAKSPEDMLEFRIPNDLSLVINRIKDYYNGDETDTDD